MKLKRWITMPLQQQLAALMAVMTTALAIIGLLNPHLSADYEGSSRVWVALAAIACSWGLYGIQRRLAAYHRLGTFIVLFYSLLPVVFISVYLPKLVAELWGLLLFYPILISMFATLKVYGYASAVFLLYYALYTTVILPAQMSAEDGLSNTPTLLKLMFAVGSVLLGAILLSGKHQLRQRSEALSLQQQKRQIVNILECFIPVGERKTQSSRKEIHEMSRLLKALWRELGHGSGKDWEIDLLSMLHYVSRVKLPDYMFEKTGKLSGFELEVVQEHCFMAKELCDGIPAFEEIQSAFLCHHEKIDGTGYPFQLSGDRIPLLSQALGLVEVYMAMTAPRSYRDAMSEQAAYEELRMMQGEYFRADLVTAFGKVIAAPAA